MQSQWGQLRNNWRTSSGTMKIISFLSCLLYVLALTEGAIIKAEGFEGRSVTFQCPNILAWKNHKYLCKDPCKRTEDILVTVKSGRRAESGRITLVDFGDGSFSVTFSHLQLSDSQKYWCAVDRAFFDTYTEVQLTVKQAVEIQTVIPDVSSTWTNQNTNSTKLTTGTGTPKPTKLSTDLNFTCEGEPKISTGNIIYATVGGTGLISLSIMAIWFRKSRRTSNHKLQVSSNSADLSNANEGEVREYNDPDNRTLSESSVTSHQQRQDLPTPESTAAKCSIPNAIYETTYLPNLPADSGNSPMEDQNDFAIYNI